MWLVVIALVGYLVGSVPFGFLIGKMRGIDIREHGSKNIGATNVLRVLGKKWGYSTFALDVLKGLAAVGFARWYSSGDVIGGITAGVACILGHNFPVWLKFKGGKGIATSAGVLVALLWHAVLAITIVWIIVFYSTRYVSLASVSAAACLPVTVFALTMTGFIQGWALFIFATVIAVLAIWRHKSNIQRLLQGTESRFESRRKKA